MCKAREARIAKQDDKDGFYSLWNVCFQDSAAFCDWLFRVRFYPAYSSCLEDDEGAIVSAMQAVPYTFVIRGKAVNGAMLCGVSTSPAQRKKGFMRKVFRHEMELLYKKDLIIASHTPAVLDSYFSFGHLPVADANYFFSECIPYFPRASDVVSMDQIIHVSNDLFLLYTNIARNYSGMILRTREEFQRKADDYAADGGKCVTICDNERVMGYAFYYVDEGRIVCVEALAEIGYYNQLLEGLFSLYEGYRISVKLPPDILPEYVFGELKKLPKGVAGAINIPKLLQVLDIKSPYSVEITDDVVLKNTGIFNLNGLPSGKEAAFRIEAGRFLQVLIGYHSLEEIRNEIEIFDEDAFLDISSRLPKQKCYIIDEY